MDRSIMNLYSLLSSIENYKPGNRILKMCTILILLAGLNISCDYEMTDVNKIINAWKESSKNIEIVSYEVAKIDTFADGGVWHKHGHAIIESKRDDSLFGFYFFGERSDVNIQYIYDGSSEFRINEDEKSYSMAKPGYGFLGSPGGQMVVKEILYRDSIYKSVRLTGVTDHSYIIKYTFENDTVYEVTNRTKMVELDKVNFLPVRIIYSYLANDSRGVHEAKIYNIEINEKVDESITQIKRKLLDYKLMQEKESSSVSSLISCKAPEFNLPLLQDENKYMQLQTEKIILLDFWEVWCSPCIASLPKVEELHRKYSDQIDVYGIVSDDYENAKKMILKKAVSFTTLMGNSDILDKYGVKSYPRYFLIDKNGIVLKEYFGFTDKIESDIVDLLK